MPRKRKRKAKPKLPRRLIFDLEKALGAISLEWNYAEDHYNKIISYYLVPLGADVCSAILNSMGATQKAAFFGFLLDKFETHTGLRELIEHYRKCFHIVTENRNIVAHSLPEHPLYYGGYSGVIYKLNRLGKPIPYQATESDLQEVYETIQTLIGYGAEVEAMIRKQRIFVLEGANWTKKRAKKDREVFEAWIAYIETPPLPRALIPRQLAEDQKAGRPPQKPSGQ